MAVKLNSPDWQIRTATTRGGGPAAAALSDFPPAFLTSQSSIEATFVAQPRPQVRGARAPAGALDFSCDLGPGEAAVVAVRHPSGALTFHPPVDTTRATRGGPSSARFVVPIQPVQSGPAQRGIVSSAIKAMVIKVTKKAVEAVVGVAMRTLAEQVEKALWKKKNLKEGWLKVDRASLAAGQLAPGRPSSTTRSLLLVHGTFSNAAAAYRPLAASDFFDQIAPLYGDRIFAFDHFSISRTPEENARMLLEGLPDKPFHFDVVTHSRGGLVLRNFVERAAAIGPLASRFTLGQAVLVGVPNEGTPLATPRRWEDTIGWVANLLELFPDNPFTSGAELVANGIVWMAGRVSADLPGLHAMDGDGGLIRELQGPPGPPADRYSALVANYNPTGAVLRRLLDVGVDQFFNTANDLVVPSEGGWRVDPSGGAFIPGVRIGCFGPGGNIQGADVNHVSFFSQPAARSFIVAALAGQPQTLAPIDPAKTLPDRRLLRAGAEGVAAPAVAAAAAAAARARIRGPVTEPAAAPPGVRPLTVSVLNGDLAYERWPMLAGHYRALLLTGTERVLDGLLDGAMKRTLDLGVYPSDPGTHRIFINTYLDANKAWLTPRPAAVIVAGLGAEGKLQAGDLVRTVRQAVIAWAERRAENGERQESFDLAATLLGSGGAGVTAGQAAQLIAQGVYEANTRLAHYANRSGLPQVRELRFVELYLDRASDAWRSLKMHAETNPGQFDVTEPVLEGAGWLPRPLDSGYRGAEYDFIKAETRRDVEGQTSIAYALDTRRARTEIRAQATQSGLLRNLIATASTDQTADEQIGRTLFQLLVPLELESYLSGSADMQIEVDAGTAGIPWELLDDSDPTRASQLPWAIRSKLLRKFRTETFRNQVRDADSVSSILVIGEPESPADYAPLPGARQEAVDVLTALTNDGGLDRRHVTSLFSTEPTRPGPDARTVINALFERDWRIIHIAGHGTPTGADGGAGGVVLSNDTFLGASEISAMRTVPELVFVNCCYIGGLGARSLLRTDQERRDLYDRTLFASSVAEALINIGVRCVVAAGWAIDDAAAGGFAKTFYGALLGGRRFIDAVAQARHEAYKSEGNTWAAYQCYGDPDWVFRRDPQLASKDDRPSEKEFDNIGSMTSLELALKTLLVQSTFQGYEASRQHLRAENLEERWKRMNWPVSGGAAQLFAEVFAAADDFPKAIEWYERAIEDSSGDVSLRFIEQASNLRIRHAWRLVESAKERRATAPRRARADGSVRAALNDARRVIAEETRVLAKLSAFNTTLERESLLGGNMKRLAMVEAEAGRTGAEARAFEAMKRHYRRAVDIGREKQTSNLFYPAMNMLVADLARHAGTRQWKGLDRQVVELARQSLRAKNEGDPDFWSLVGQTELRMYEVIAANSWGREAATIQRGFADLFKRSQGSRHWRSVYDTADFVLSRYITRASPAARRAAEDLLAQLEKYAGAAEPRQRRVRSRRA